MTSATRRVPVVNLSDYRSGSPEQRARFIQVFGDALKEFGFVSVEGHGIDDALIRRTYTDVERFFHLPDEVKRQYTVPGGAGQRGYTGYGQEHAHNGPRGDPKQAAH